MKKCSVSLLSKAKILISVILALTVVCTMAVTISAANANEGYATANATVFTPLQIFSAITYVKDKVEEPVFNGGQYNSDVWKFAVTKNDASSYTILAPGKYVSLSAEVYYPFESQDVKSYYKFHAMNKGGSQNAKLYKRIEYIAAENEKMSFGFTTPIAGMYEISAPIVAASEKNVNFAVYKTTTEGKRVCLQSEQSYIAQSKFCCLQVNLSAGETVWLEATADNGTVIEIGMPQALRYNTAVTDENSTTYKYRVLDYFEDKETNGIDYTTGNYSPAKVSGAWDFGYFKFSGTFGTKADAFAPSDIILPTEAKGQIDASVRAAMKKYEFLRNGNYYKTHDATYVDGNESTTAEVVPGVMYADGLEATLANATGIKTYFHFHNGQEGVIETFTAYGNWFEFTAPVAGEALYSSPTKLANGFRMIIAVNDIVKVCTYLTKDAASAISLGNLQEGDKVTVLYYSIKSAKANQSVIIADPTITLTDTYNTLKLDADGGEDSFEKYLASGTEVTLPTPKKDGADFLGWSDGENTYKGGDVYTVTTDATLTATYQSLESQVDYDLDGDYVVDGADLVILRNYLLENGIIAEDRLPFADKNGKEGIDIRDLVHIRALIAVS